MILPSPYTHFEPDERVAPKPPRIPRQTKMDGWTVLNGVVTFIILGAMLIATLLWLANRWSSPSHQELWEWTQEHTEMKWPRMPMVVLLPPSELDERRIQGSLNPDLAAQFSAIGFQLKFTEQIFVDKDLPQCELEEALTHEMTHYLQEKNHGATLGNQEAYQREMEAWIVGQVRLRECQE